MYTRTTPPVAVHPHREVEFWRFVAERQSIFDARRHNEPLPWTSDDTLATNRFTNVYRAADRVSQFLIATVIGEGSQLPEEVVFRVLLMRIFNLPATYAHISTTLGEPPSLATWDPARYTAIVRDREARGKQIWNGAYIMRAPTSHFGAGPGSKTAGWMAILGQMIDDRFLRTIVERNSLQFTIEAFQRYPTVGPFLALQYATDIGYTSAVTWDENDVVVPGVGALRGAYRMIAEPLPIAHMPILTPPLIEYLVTTQTEAFARAERRFTPIGGVNGRPLSLIDVQNCLCEFDKYCRATLPPVEGMPSRIKQRFSPGVAQYANPTVFTWPVRWHLPTEW